MGGPADRLTFTKAKPANYPVFNAITDNPKVGDERNFVTIREVGEGKKFVNEVNIVAGKEYEVSVIFHNNANPSLNDILNEGGIGIAVDARISAIVPQVVKKGERKPISSIISAANTNPLKVWDEAYVSASAGTINFRYVPGSATVISNGAVNKNILPDTLFSELGTFLGFTALNGVIPGGMEFMGEVRYRLKSDAPNFSINYTVSKDKKVFKVDKK